jgi:hypothetical protein
MDVACLHGEIAIGSNKKKMQSVAFVCAEDKFQFIEIHELKCWRVNGEVLGLARMAKGVRNCAWQKLFPHAKIFVVKDRRHWADIKKALSDVETYEDNTHLQAVKDAKRALRIFQKSRNRRVGEKLTEELFRAYVARLRLLTDEELQSDDGV